MKKRMAFAGILLAALILVGCGSTIYESSVAPSLASVTFVNNSSYAVDVKATVNGESKEFTLNALLGFKNFTLVRDNIIFTAKSSGKVTAEIDDGQVTFK
jgi:hypothetical protein